MKATQAVRILNAHKYLGHRCWRFRPTLQGKGIVETYPHGCSCLAAPEFWCFDAIEAVAYARCVLGEVKQEDLPLLYHDPKNYPEPEVPLPDSK